MGGSVDVVKIESAKPIDPQPRPAADGARGGTPEPLNTSQNDGPFVVSVRPMHAPRDWAERFDHTTPLEALRAALDYADCRGAEPVIEWTGTDRLAALDIDYHGAVKPRRELLEVFAARFDMPPVAWWITHGDGLRMMYATRDGYSAHELAAVAGYHFRTVASRRGLHGWTGVEVKNKTRHPRYPRQDGTVAGGVYFPAAGAFNLRQCVGKLLGERAEVDADAVEDYLQERGWVRGQNLPHDRCPIDPGATTTHPTCVTALDGGLYCHKCAAEGRTRGGGKPGFAPYIALIEGEATRTNPIRVMVRNWTHWAHARHVFRHHVGTPERDAESLYRALLKMWHLDGVTLGDNADEAAYKDEVDTQLKSVFSPDLTVIRLGDFWSSDRNPGAPVRDKAEDGYLKALSGTHYIDKTTGKRQSMKLAPFQDHGDLTEKGYPALTPIRGVDLFRQIGNPDRAGDRTPILVPTRPPFRYHDAQERDGYPIAMTSWRQHFDRAFPGVSIDCLKLLIGAAAYMQKPGVTEPIRIMFTGPSGSGKTTTVDIAADVLGGTVGGVNLQGDPDKFARAYDRAAAAHPFALTDECAKTKLSATDFGARALAIRAGASFHRMYHGAAGLSRLVPHIYTDTLLPDAMLKDSQLRRRFLHARFPTSIPKVNDWQESSGGVIGWRARNELNTDAADMLVSEVMDDLAALHPDAKFSDYAAKLGVQLLNVNAADGYDADEVFRELFAAAVRASESAKPDGKFKGKGWVVFDPTDAACPVAAAWRECGDEAGNVDKQTISGRQWNELLGIEGLQCDTQKHGRKIGLRFSVGNPRAKDFKVGRAILDMLPVGHELRPTDDTPSAGREVATENDGSRQPAAESRQASRQDEILENQANPSI